MGSHMEYATFCHSLHCAAFMPRTWLRVGPTTELVVDHKCTICGVTQSDGGFLSSLGECSLGTALSGAVGPILFATLRRALEEAEDAIEFCTMKGQTVQVTTYCHEDHTHFLLLDITEHLAVERKMQAAPDKGIVLYAASGRMLSCTAETPSILGVTPEDVVKMFYRGEDPDGVLATLRRSDAERPRIVTDVALANGLRLARYVHTTDLGYRTVTYLDATAAVRRREFEQERFITDAGIRASILDEARARIRQFGLQKKTALATGSPEDGLKCETLPEQEHLFVSGTYDGYQRTIAHRYRIEHNLSDEWMREQRKSGLFPAVDARDRRFDYNLISAAFPDIGAWYPREAITDEEVILFSVQAIYDELFGPGSEGRALRHTAECLKNMYSTAESAPRTLPIFEEFRDCAVPAEGDVSDLDLIHPRVVDHVRHLAVHTSWRTALYAVYCEARGLTSPEVLRFWGGGNVADGERYGAWKKDLNRKGKLLKENIMRPLADDPKMQAWLKEARGKFVQQQMPPADKPSADYALELEAYLERHPEQRKATVAGGEGIPPERRFGYRKTSFDKSLEARLERLAARRARAGS